MTETFYLYDKTELTGQPLVLCKDDTWKIRRDCDFDREVLLFDNYFDAYDKRQSLLSEDELIGAARCDKRVFPNYERSPFVLLAQVNGEWTIQDRCLAQNRLDACTDFLVSHDATVVALSDVGQYGVMVLGLEEAKKKEKK